MKKIVCLFVIVIALSSCKKDEVNQPKPGYFILTELKSSHLKSAGVDSVKNQFSLGDLKASKEYFFILSNGGEQSIYDVEFTSDNPAFKVFPEKIKELGGAQSAKNLIPLISLDVIHGTRLNGIGYTNLLPMDINSAIITISGKIIEKGDSVVIKSTYSFNVNAKVMDVLIFRDNLEIDITKPTGAVSSSPNLGGLGFIRYFSVTSKNITIKNNGNIDISSIDYRQNMGDMIKGQPVAIAKGDSIHLILKSGLTIIELDSDGTITNDDRIQLGNNGKGYFGFHLNQPDTIYNNPTH